MSNINTLKNLIDKSKNIVVMTGAGMSVPSGIPDFRSANGLYNEKQYEISPETILSYSFFKENPEAFYSFYRDKMCYLEALPNSGHKTLAKLEEMGKIKAIITQNIDGLHQLAGSKNVLELHGSILNNFCMNCGEKFSVSKVLETKGVPRCDCGGMIKPDVTLYEEALCNQVIEKSLDAVQKADLLIVVGTSLLVYPAAALIHYFRGSHLVIINMEETPYDDMAQLVIHKPLESILTSAIL